MQRCRARSTKRNAGTAAAVCGLLGGVLVSILASTIAPRVQAEGDAGATPRKAGFEAVISGAYRGEVSGGGVLKFLPGAGLEKRGYYFLADGQGVRPHGVTFVLPPDVAPGHQVLVSPSPLDIGTVPSVRVDRDMGDAVASAERNTSGYLDLVDFPDDAHDLSGARVTGDFVFETEDSQGRGIEVRGKFDFEAE